MEICFREQASVLSNKIPQFKTHSLSFKTLEGIPSRTIRCPILHTSGNLLNCDLSFFFQYHIFPPHILSFYGEWQKEGREMRVGDIIVQEAKIPPCLISLKLIFAVRILDIYYEANRVGYLYGTLEGHPETGVNEFSFLQENETLYAQVQTTASLGLPMSRVLGPFFTKPYVRFCNRQALQTMKKHFLRLNQAKMTR